MGGGGINSEGRRREGTEKGKSLDITSGDVVDLKSSDKKTGLKDLKMRIEATEQEEGSY